MPPVKLISKAEWETLTPRQQGWACYMQGNLPGSELSRIHGPWPTGAQALKEFAAGEFEAMMAAQDSEE